MKAITSLSDRAARAAPRREDRRGLDRRGAARPARRARPISGSGAHDRRRPGRRQRQAAARSIAPMRPRARCSSRARPATARCRCCATSARRARGRDRRAGRQQRRRQDDAAARALARDPERAGTSRSTAVDSPGAPPDEVFALGLVQVPEGRQLFDRMSVEDNLRMGAYRRRDATGDRGRPRHACTSSSRGSPSAAASSRAACRAASSRCARWRAR